MSSALALVILYWPYETSYSRVTDLDLIAEVRAACADTHWLISAVKESEGLRGELFILWYEDVLPEFDMAVYQSLLSQDQRQSLVQDGGGHKLQVIRAPSLN